MRKRTVSEEIQQMRCNLRDAIAEAEGVSEQSNFKKAALLAGIIGCSRQSVSNATDGISSFKKPFVTKLDSYLKKKEIPLSAYCFLNPDRADQSGAATTPIEPVAKAKRSKTMQQNSEAELKKETSKSEDAPSSIACKREVRVSSGANGETILTLSKEYKVSISTGPHGPNVSVD